MARPYIRHYCFYHWLHMVFNEEISMLLESESRIEKQDESVLMPSQLHRCMVCSQINERDSNI